MSGSSGSQRASRSRNTPTSPGASTRGARSPIRVVPDPVGARPSNNIFGALAEDEAGDGAEDPGPHFSASSPFYSSWFSKNMAARKFGDLPLEPLLEYLPADGGTLFREALGFQCYVDPERAAAYIAFTAPMDSVLSQLRQRQDFDVNMFQGFFIPEDGLNAQQVINLFALFDKTLLGISPSCDS